MSYYIYKLSFKSGIHFGTTRGSVGLDKTSITMASDTLFSALVTEYLKIHGQTNFENLIKTAESGNILVSDLLPYIDDILFIPKPYVQVMKEEGISHPDPAFKNKKQVKNTHFIPINMLSSYLNYLKHGGEWPLDDYVFGAFDLQTKNRLGFENDNLLYDVETFKFSQNAGLYFILKCPDDLHATLEKAIESLSMTGLGGKKSAGYGGFEFYTDPMHLYLDDDVMIESESDLLIKNALRTKSKHYLLMSHYLPIESEIQWLGDSDAFYGLSKRSGFVTSHSYSQTPQKRKQVHMLTSGALLPFEPKGCVVDLKLHGEHSVYRFGMPICLGVNLLE